jgi:1-acyl-sn-glycerol-3-phosphate acyltransferase
MYRILILVAHFLLFMFSRTRVTGKTKVPAGGALLIVSNHLSVADPVLLGAKLGRKVTFLAKEELFKNKLSAFFVKSYGGIEIFRGSSNRDALRQAAGLLKRGGVLGMFPEGKRSRAGAMTTGQLGAALIAYHNRVKILPVSITGTEVIHGTGWMLRRPRVLITIGEPFYLREVGSTLRKEQLTEFTDIIMKKVAVLLPEKYQGEYVGGKNEDHQS